jgi:DNA recombination protein RmuC
MPDLFPDQVLSERELRQAVTDIHMIAVIVLLVGVTALLILLFRRIIQGNDAVLSRMGLFETAQERMERAVREEVARSRDELARAAREQRQELAETFRIFSDAVMQRILDAANMQKGQLDSFAEHLTGFTRISGERLDSIRSESATQAKHLREEVLAGLNAISESNVSAMRELAVIQKDQLEAMSNVISNLSNSNEKKLEAVRVTVENRLQNLQADNARQLEQMRQTVDEKLQGTLEKRLGESFRQVSERLELVHKGLGEMQTLAVGVGDLKKVLTNVKTRGTWGEVQLGALLEQALNPEQFAVNVATKDAAERVEFAVRLPGQGTDRNEVVWLPIDAKFPVEDYQRLLEAQESSDSGAVEELGKKLETRVKICASDISKKYLNPPKTTDFGILFLPIEGLFAEVIRRTGLVEAVQREYRVVIAGPTTLWSILNSLQMGFRTLAIQKRSGEVWNLLAAVKTEFSKYGEILDAVQKKLHQASDTIDKAKTRSRVVSRKLKEVQEFPVHEAEALLPPMDMLEDEQPDEGQQD